ncbi:hypothetical protein E2L08_11470 [Palleronia sediminis]|uniref:EF-hand domain-containing protein n=1 Tax=Palleronia sediminis TaxID=2547833 RepID=A0A4R6A622_9RHOB|nr:hypothetical protein [Palleronia sediminis]TDL78315.1 hypothetical protein E2L08_11470 [Palleronia sediminis]
MKTTLGMGAVALALMGTGALADQHRQGNMAGPADRQEMQGMTGMQGMHGMDGMQGMSHHGRMYGDGSGMRGRMGNSMMPAMMIAMLDANGDGALSLDELEAVLGRMFAVADADDNGRINAKELRAFMGHDDRMMPKPRKDGEKKGKTRQDRQNSDRDAN